MTSKITLRPMIHITETNRRCSKIKHSLMLIAKSEAIAPNHRRIETIRRQRMRERTTLTPTKATVMETTAPATTPHLVVHLAHVLQEHQRSAQFHSRLGRLKSATFQALARATKAVVAGLVKPR
jgi:hypothetical protein